MKNIFLSSLILVSVVVSVVVFAVTAQARGGGGGGTGIIFDLNLFYESLKVDDVNSGVTTHQTDSASAIYDIKLGFLSGDGLYFGGIYTSRSNNALNASGTAGSAVGGSVGYMGSGGGFVMAHYLMNAINGEYKNGSGLQVDLGYKEGVGSGWLLGAELTYRNITYKKNETLASSFESRQAIEVMPMISVGYTF